MSAPVLLATKTMAAIEATLVRDQGASYRQALQKVLPHIGDAYRGADEGHRSHMGASLIGGECGRAIWYGFRWTTKPKFPARILRLFNRGHLEEGRIIPLLLIIGVQVFQQDADGKQYRISDVGGHFGGSGDGVAVGIPDLAPGQPCLLEFKTHNEKSFRKVKADGVRSAKFEHFVQMQTYMRKMGLAVALYVAVNKNDDDIYMELVYLDSSVGDEFVSRARVLILSQSPPPKISNSPGWLACSWCNHKPVCHLKAAPDISCRTCVYSVAREDGKWYCTEPKADAAFGDNPEIDKETQLKGCPEYKVF